MRNYKQDLIDLIFRGLFSTIFIGLGGEHIFSDDLIMHLMPEWVPEPRLASVFAGLVLLTGGLLILWGYELKKASLLLGAFLVVVTIAVHGPALIYEPDYIHTDDIWLWTILQRSNFVKNLCLLGVCFHLYYYEAKRFSLRYMLVKSNQSWTQLFQNLKTQKFRIFK